MDVRLLSALLAFIAAPAVGAAAGSPMRSLDAATLSEVCAADIQAIDARSICLGYIAGAADQLLAAQAARSQSGQSICIPPDATTLDVVAVVRAHATWSRNSKGVSGAGFVEAALQSGYPCRAEAEPM